MKKTVATSERKFLRMTLNQRIQHIMLMLSVFVLLITGFPVSFPDWGVSSGIIRMLGGFTVRSAAHHSAAGVLILLTFYHVLYMILSKRGRLELRALMPKCQDARDALHMFRFHVGLTNTRPRFDHFSYIQKFEYMALAWGTGVMIVTGLMLAMPGQAMRVLPKWAMDVAKVVHSYEALLAFLAIIIWHFYHVHLSPDVFPMSRVWVDGSISEQEMKAHHPLEYERLMKNEMAERGELVHAGEHEEVTL